MKAEQFIGMSKHSAQNLAEKHNMIFYLIRSGENFFLPYPQDKRDDRVCVEIDAGKITQAIIK